MFKVKGFVFRVMNKGILYMRIIHGLYLFAYSPTSHQ